MTLPDLKSQHEIDREEAMSGKRFVFLVSVFSAVFLGTFGLADALWPF